MCCVDLVDFDVLVSLTPYNHQLRIRTQIESCSSRWCQLEEVCACVCVEVCRGKESIEHNWCRTSITCPPPRRPSSFSPPPTHLPVTANRLPILSASHKASRSQSPIPISQTLEIFVLLHPFSPFFIIVIIIVVIIIIIITLFSIKLTSSCRRMDPLSSGQPQR